MHGTRNVATSIHLRKWNQVAAELRFFEMLRDSFRVPRPWSSQRPRIQVVRYANEGPNPQFRLVMLWDALGSGVIHPTLMLENNQDSWLTVIRWRNERQPKILWDARPLLDSGGHHRPLLGVGRGGAGLELILNDCYWFERIFWDSFTILEGRK